MGVDEVPLLLFAAPVGDAAAGRDEVEVLAVFDSDHLGRGSLPPPEQTDLAGELFSRVLQFEVKETTPGAPSLNVPFLPHWVQVESLCWDWAFEYCGWDGCCEQGM